MLLTRRQMVKVLLGSQMLGLRALASGIPPRVLADPRRALGVDPTVATPAQFLLLSTSIAGDPIGCNVPGTYADPAIVHPQDPSMAPMPVSIGGAVYSAARPWASLSPDILARLCFFHNATQTLIHSDESKILTLAGRVGQADALASLIARKNAVALQTLTDKPISVASNSSEAFFSQGALQAQFSPRALKAVLSQSDAHLQDLETLRARDLDRLNNFFKTYNPGARSAFIDQFATSQQQARALSQQVPAALDSITDDGPNAQIIAAIVMFQMRLVPAVGLNIPFGGDNHGDANLATETAQTIAGVNSLTFLYNQLRAAGLQDQVTFATLNVFGRTLTGSHMGRQHNDLHQCSLLLGPGVQASVIGGVAPHAADYSALPIDAATGAGTTAGDVALEDTLAAFALTLGATMGMDISQDIVTGSAKVVSAAVASALR